MTVKDIVNKYWPYALVLVLGILGGSALGWGLKPESVRTEEKLKVVQVEKQVVVVQEKVRIEYVKVKDTQLAERIHKEETISPDGTIKRTEDRNIDSVIKEKENTTKVEVKYVEKQVVVEKQVDRIVKIEPVLPKWHLTVQGGLRPTFSPLAVGPFNFGVGVEHRLAGPFWLGGYANTNTSFNGFEAGLRAGLEF